MINEKEIITIAKEVKIEAFDAVLANLAALRKEYAEVPSAETEKGYTFIKKGLSVLVKSRTSTEKARKVGKDYYIQCGKQIDKVASYIKDELVALEGPMKAAKTAVDEAEAEAKRKRIAELQIKVDAITAYKVKAHGQSCETIGAMIQEVTDIDALSGFYDLTAEAVTARDETLTELNRLYSERSQFEQTQRDLEEQKKKQVISDRINKLVNTPSTLMNAKPAEINDKILDLEAYQPLDKDFGDRLEEVKNSMATVIDQLRSLYDMSVIKARDAAQQETNRLEEEKNTPVESEQPEQTGINVMGGHDSREVIPDALNTGTGFSRFSINEDGEAKHKHIPVEEVYKEEPTLLAEVAAWCDVYGHTSSEYAELEEIIRRYVDGQ